MQRNGRKERKGHKNESEIVGAGFKPALLVSRFALFVSSW